MDVDGRTLVVWLVAGAVTLTVAIGLWGLILRAALYICNRSRPYDPIPAPDYSRAALCGLYSILASAPIAAVTLGIMGHLAAPTKDEFAEARQHFHSTRDRAPLMALEERKNRAPAQIQFVVGDPVLKWTVFGIILSIGFILLGGMIVTRQLQIELSEGFKVASCCVALLGGIVVLPIVLAVAIGLAK